MRNYLIISLLATTVLFGSCYYDVEEELYPTLECSTDGVTYSGVVEPLIRAKCYSCHDAATNSGNHTLEGYDKLKSYVDNGKLLGAIKHSPGFSPMPKGQAKLVDCDIEKIEAWVTAGAPQ